MLGRPDWMMNHGSFASLKFKWQPHWLKGQQQICEDDRGVHSEFLSRSDGYFCSYLRLLADLHQCVVLADVAVLLHVPAGLAEKPDGSAVDRAAQTGVDESAAVEDRIRRGWGYETWVHTSLDFIG